MFNPTDVTMSAKLPKAQMITLASALLLKHQIGNIGFREPVVLVWTEQGNLTTDQALANDLINLTDKYPFHLLWLDEDGEPISNEAVVAAAFLYEKGRSSEFISRLLGTAWGQRIMPGNRGTDADVWTYVRISNHPSFVSLEDKFVRGLEAIIGA